MGLSFKSIGRGLGITGKPFSKPFKFLGQVAGTAGGMGMLGPWGYAGAAVLGGMSSPDMPPEYQAAMDEAMRRLQNPQGYSPEELAQLQQALTSALGQQRDMQLGQLRSNMIQSGTFDSGQYAQEAARINSSYADALSQGVANILGQGQALGRETWRQAGYMALQGAGMYLNQQQSQQQGLSDIASTYAYLKEMKRRRPRDERQSGNTYNIYGSGYQPQGYGGGYQPPGYGGDPYGGAAPWRPQYQSGQGV